MTLTLDRLNQSVTIAGATSTADLSVDQAAITLQREDQTLEIEHPSHTISLATGSQTATLDAGANTLSLNIDASISPTADVEAYFIEAANCTASEAIGDCVYVSAAMVGSKYQVRKVDVTDIAKLPAWGVIKDKASDTDCRVQWGGKLTSVFTGLTPGKLYVIGSSAQPVEAMPSISGDWFHQRIGIAIDDEILLLNIDGLLTKRHD